MAGPIEKRIYVLAAIAMGILAASAIVPRFVPDRGGGLGGAVTAAIWFMGLALLAALFSLGIFVYTLRRYAALSLPARVVGIAPVVLIGGGLVVLVFTLRF